MEFQALRSPGGTYARATAPTSGLTCSRCRASCAAARGSEAQSGDAGDVTRIVSWVPLIVRGLSTELPVVPCRFRIGDRSQLR